MVYYRHCRFAGKVQKILDEETAMGHKLKSAVMGDLATRYDMMFEDSEIKYTYVHECCRTGGKLTKIVNEYENRGYKLVFHTMGDLATRHELFFEKEVK
jgi:predicted amidohydrolase YtcJ